MKRYPLVGIMAAGVSTALVLLGFAFVGAKGAGPAGTGGGRQVQVVPNAFPQPDTTSPDWKRISDELGIWIATSDPTGLRGRLYVRRGDAWWPVAVDGLGDVQGLFPVR